MLDARQPGSLARRLGFPALLCATLAIAVFLRFFMISAIGISGDDTLYYLSLTRGWAEEQRPDFRIVIRALYSLTYHLAGPSDWSIKGLNASLDIANTLLVFWISLRLGGQRTLAWIITLSYVFMPRAIAFARTELLHTGSTTFLLLSCAAWVHHLADRAGSNRTPWLVAAGVFLALSYGVHEDLILFFPGMLFCVAAVNLPRPLLPVRASRYGRVWIQSGVFAGATVLVLSPLGFWRTLLRHLPELDRRFGASAGGAGSVESTGEQILSISYPEIFESMIVLNSTGLVAALFFGSVVAAALIALVWVGRALRHEPLPEIARDLKLVEFAPAILVFSYLLLYPLTSTYLFPRLFVPALPLVMMTVFVWMDRCLTAVVRRPPWKDVAVVTLGILVTALNFFGYQKIPDMQATLPSDRRYSYRLYAPNTLPRDLRDIFDGSKYPISPYRRVYDALEARVNEQNRLLVTPYLISSWDGERRGFRHYFGDSSVYVEDCEGDLESFMRSRRIRYVVFTRFHNKGLTRDPVCLGLTRDDYSLRKEVNTFRRVLTRAFDLEVVEASDAYTILAIRPRRDVRRPGSTPTPSHGELDPAPARPEAGSMEVRDADGALRLGTGPGSYRDGSAAGRLPAATLERRCTSPRSPLPCCSRWPRVRWRSLTRAPAAGVANGRSRWRTASSAGGTGACNGL
jgi:hypothetical protein